VGTATVVHTQAGAAYAFTPEKRPGLVTVRRLDWDSAFFGHEMAVVEVAPRPAPRSNAAQELREVLNAQGRAFDHLILRVDADDHAIIWAAESCGMRLVDVGIDSTVTLADVRRPAVEGLELVRPLVPEDVETLREIAAASFVASRFAADPFFTAGHVAEFHRTWISNLCDGQADAVLVYEGGDGPLGFVACTIADGAGRIVLIATDARARRRGVGRALTLAALQQCAVRGAATVSVKTQAHNYAALALYARAGFAVSRAQLVFSRAAAQQDV
jgi:ribosomal protein S18 acetylase RimI-like enzyme